MVCQIPIKVFKSLNRECPQKPTQIQRGSKLRGRAHFRDLDGMIICFANELSGKLLDSLVIFFCQ